MKSVETKPDDGIAVVRPDPRTRENGAAKLAEQVSQAVNRTVTS